MLLYATCLLVGFLVGLTGIGGILVPPVLLLSGMDVHVAMGTALASFFPLALVGAWLYKRMDSLDWTTTFWLSLGGLGGALPGALLNAWCQSGFLIVVMALIIILAGLNTLRPVKGSGIKPFWHTRTGIVLTGLVTGALSGLTGVGGPVLSVPWMIVVGFAPMQAIGAAMPYMAAVTFSGSIGNWMNNYLALDLLPALSGLQILGILAGTALVRHIPTALLRKLIGYVCVGLGLFVLVRHFV